MAKRGQIVLQVRVLFALFLVIFGTVMIEPIKGITAQQTATGVPWLHVQGNRIVDENNATVILRGVAIEDQCNMYLTQRHRFDKTDFVELVQNWHVNVLRVPVLPDLWGSCPNYAENILDPIVDWGHTYGTYVLLDWHAIGNPITGKTNQLDYNSSFPYHGNPNNPNISLAMNFWDSVAERYKSDPWVIYDIFNEPAYITWKDWKPAAEQLVDIVRSHNPRALILVPGVSWTYDLRDAGQDPVGRQNIVYDVHPYPSKTTHYGPWDQYFGYLTNDYPVFASEWGFQPGDPDPGLDATAESYGKPLLSYMAQKNISWTGWCWSAIWDPLMVESYVSYVPTQFGQLVKDALEVPLTTSSSTNSVTQSSTSQVVSSTATSPATTTTSSTINSSSSTVTQSSTSQVMNSTTPSYASTTTTLPSSTQSTTGSTTNSTSLPTTQTSTQSSINGVQTVTVTQSPPPTTITNSVTVTQLVTQTQTVTQSLLTSNSVTSSTSSSSSATVSSSSTSRSSSKIVSTTSSKTSSTTAKTPPTKIDRGRNEIYYLLPAQDASSWWNSILLLIFGAWLALRLPHYVTGGLSASRFAKLSVRSTSKP